jgi:uncharacterized membrane protein
VWLDNHLEAPTREADLNRDVSGELWAVHGGGFYHAEIAVAPKGILFDSDAQIRAQAALIVQQSVTTKVMPPGNLTQMTDDERALVARWAASVAPRVTP